MHKNLFDVPKDYKTIQLSREVELFEKWWSTATAETQISLTIFCLVAF